MTTCFSYWPGSTLVSISAIAPYMCMLMMSSMSSWIKYTGILTLATSRPSRTSIIHYRIISAVIMVGDIASSIFMYPWFFQLSAHLWPLMRPQHFFFKKMRYLSADWLSSLVIFVGSLGYIAPFWCNWMIYSSTYSALSSLYNIIPLFTSYLVRRLWCT